MKKPHVERQGEQKQRGSREATEHKLAKLIQDIHGVEFGGMRPARRAFSEPSFI
jgi:hypothetical protein